jgi:hypothetical protein
MNTVGGNVRLTCFISVKLGVDGTAIEFNFDSCWSNGAVTFRIPYIKINHKQVEWEVYRPGSNG